eukprot:SM000099S25245  [mRNA]  locus=s99:508141:510925:+ [translate_table: standard]
MLGQRLLVSFGRLLALSATPGLPLPVPHLFCLPSKGGHNVLPAEVAAQLLLGPSTLEELAASHSCRLSCLWQLAGGMAVMRRLNSLITAPGKCLPAHAPQIGLDLPRYAALHDAHWQPSLRANLDSLDLHTFLHVHRYSRPELYAKCHLLLPYLARSYSSSIVRQPLARSTSGCSLLHVNECPPNLHEAGTRGKDFHDLVDSKGRDELGQMASIGAATRMLALTRLVFRPIFSTFTDHTGNKSSRLGKSPPLNDMSRLHVLRDGEARSCGSRLADVCAQLNEAQRLTMMAFQLPERALRDICTKGRAVARSLPQLVPAGSWNATTPGRQQGPSGAKLAHA